ncbi:MAG: PDZ domain-containing protein, partial [Holophagales bacterium]|nr:PDZ domain-containing protein [Holophagales bacterium]
AVLDNELLATRAELWIWPAGPGPAVPDRLTLPLGDPEALRQLRQRLDLRVPLRRPWLGALVIDSDASPHPVVASVTPASPAEAADLRVGDQILGFGGLPIQSRAGLEERLAAAETGETVELAVRTGGQGRSLELRLGSSPSVEIDAPGLLPSVAWADLVIQKEKVAASEAWLVSLDQGLLQLRAGDVEAAVALLRGIRAPQSSHGLGQAAVDYWLALALSRAGSNYRDGARQSFEKAASLPGARLDHHDGPYLQPRARARLRLLGPG